MLPEPLHPAVVHFPIVLTALLPLVALAAIVAARRGVAHRRAWSWAVLVAAALLVSSWAAVQTGEAQEEVVERVVAEAPLHDHEESAETFLRLAGAVFLVFGLGLIGGRPGAYARFAGLAVAVLLVGAGYRVGSSGGDLVYRYGAASAYAGVEARTEHMGNPDLRDRHERDEEDRDER